MFCPECLQVPQAEGSRFPRPSLHQGLNAITASQVAAKSQKKKPQSTGRCEPIYSLRLFREFSRQTGKLTAEPAGSDHGRSTVRRRYLYMPSTSRSAARVGRRGGPWRDVERVEEGYKSGISTERLATRSFTRAAWNRQNARFGLDLLAWIEAETSLLAPS